MQNSKPSQAAWPHSGDYFIVHGYALLPMDLMPDVVDRGIRLDWDYEGRNLTKVWKFHKDPQISFEVWRENRLTAMRVLQKLED